MRRLSRTLSVSLSALLAVAVTATSCADLATISASPDLRAVEQPILAASHLPDVRISEIHYDNAGTDVNERVEVSGPAGTSLAGWSIVLVNGANGTIYDTDALTGATGVVNGAIPATCGTRGVVVLGYPSNGIQNGAPDGIALVNNGVVVEFLSYEGPMTGVGGVTNNLTATDIGVSQAGTEATTASLQRAGSGAWSASSTSNTFGACNDNVHPVAVDHITVAPASATIVEGGSQQFTATAFDDDDQELSGVVFSWSSSNNNIATVSASGVATGVAEGDVEIRAAVGTTSATAALRVSEAPIPDLPTVRFSEVHYDNVATDVGEALEIEGPAGTDLTGWSVVLYNGSGGVSYDTRALTGSIPDMCAGRGVVVVRYEQDGIQNGPQDGFALINAANEVVEFLSYEGVLTATNGPAAGRQSADIGVAQSSAPHFQTLQRRPAGKWDTQKASTLGGCYGSTPVTPFNQVSFSGRVPFDAPLPVGFEDQLFGTLRAPNDATVQTTFTWESLTPEIASIDEDGVMRALAAGTATFRATAQDGTTAVYSLPMALATASTTALYGNHAEFGEPTDGDASDDFLIRRAEFTSSFNRLRNIPNWVSYNLEATHITAGQDRCDCFTYDPMLPAEFTRYTTADYTGAGAAAGFGIDRGHLARSFDRTSGSLDNARTFYFSNIVPQTADVNQRPWANFENYLGNLAQNENKEVYIVTGASGSRGTVKNEGLITIPALTWKVAVIMPRNQGLADVDSYDDIQVIAVIMPNIPQPANVLNAEWNDWTRYVTTVNAVEAASGYDVLALLPDKVESAVEAGMQDEMALVDALVSGGALDDGNGNALMSKLEAAAASIERGNGNAAGNQLGALLNQIDAMVRSRRLTAAEAAPLRAAVTALAASVAPGA